MGSAPIASSIAIKANLMARMFMLNFLSFGGDSVNKERQYAHYCILPGL
jgi:hypothetical protein